MSEFTDEFTERARQRSKELGRKLTAKELIELINEPDPDEVKDLEIVYDEEENKPLDTN